MRALIFTLVTLFLADVAPRSIRLNPRRLVEIATLSGGASWLMAPGGRYLANRNAGGVTLLDVATGKEHEVPSLNGVHDGGWSGNGNLLALACNDASVIVWDAAARKEIVSVSPHAGYS